MALTNRAAQNLNRRKLEVVSDVLENGKRVLTVDVTRAEGTVTATGTKLDATTLTNEIKSIVQSTSGGSATTAITQCECDKSTKIATTEFVWNVLISLGLNKIIHNHNSSGGSGNIETDT